MRRIALIVIPIIVIAALGTTLLITTVNQLPAWQDEFGHYLHYKNTLTPGEYEIQRIIVASRPWNFNADMSEATFGESVYYQTDFWYGDEQPDQNRLDFIPVDTTDGSLMPLPFPPEKLWCVFIENKVGSGSGFNNQVRTELVLAALHQDLYNADIIIHESFAESLLEIEEITALIGGLCLLAIKGCPPLQRKAQGRRSQEFHDFTHGPHFTSGGL